MDAGTARRVIADVLGTIAPEANLDELADDAPLQDELDLDSMNFVDFVAGLYQRTGVDVPERDYARITTLASCAAYLCEHG